MIAFRLLVITIATLVALAFAGLLVTVLFGASLTDRAASTCAEQGEESGITWHWLPPAWDCTRTYEDGHTASGRIHLWSPGKFSP
ncbi:MAG: hypothetical protein ACJ74O_06250 [Frankiaceae bacterium]